MNQKMLGYEKRKVAIDMLKHLTTLSLGAIAVIASFLQKFLEFEKAKNLLSLSVGSFFICVIFSIIACLILLANIENLPEIHGSGMHNFLRVSFLLSISGFVIGTFSLAWLVVYNIA
jgi:hypothetical protein